MILHGYNIWGKHPLIKFSSAPNVNTMTVGNEQHTSNPPNHVTMTCVCCWQIGDVHETWQAASKEEWLRAIHCSTGPCRTLAVPLEVKGVEKVIRCRRFLRHWRCHKIAQNTEDQLCKPHNFGLDGNKLSNYEVMCCRWGLCDVSSWCQV